MTIRDWLRPPRHLVALFLLLTLVPSLLLIGFGWRLLGQDLELERQQVDASREQAADVIVAALEQAVSATEGVMTAALQGASFAPPAGGAAVIFTADGAEVFPRGRLLFHPVARPGIEALGAVFAAGELIEFRDKDFPRAAAWFRQLSRSSPEAVRAGAEIRRARNLRKAGHIAEALDVYANLSAPTSAVGGVPVELLARWARGDLMAAAGPSPQLQQEGRALVADLLAGRWTLDRAQFTLHFADAARWAGDAVPSVPPEGMALSEAVEQLHQQWRRIAPAENFSGRSARTIGGLLITQLWRGTGERGVAFVASPQYVQVEWVDRLSPLLARNAVRTSVSDPAIRAPAAPGQRRSAAETGLPWTLAIEATSEARPARFSGRRTVWLAGLGVIALLVASGTYVVGRAVSRELAVARLQSDFVSAVSHEFRTPLTSLRQLSELLIDRPSMPERRRQSYYEALARQTTRLHRLVEGLLDFGRLEAGTSPYRPVPLEMTTFLSDLVQQFADDAAAPGHEVRLDCPAAVGIVCGDRDGLTSALWNLLDNAVKYSPASRRVDVTVRAHDGILSIAVHDHGPGIPEAEHQEVFGRFVRGAAARAGNIPGTGLGLAMVRQIAVTHGGTVALQSTPGHGSTFTLTLPLAPSAAAAAQEASCSAS